VTSEAKIFLLVRFLHQQAECPVRSPPFSQGALALAVAKSNVADSPTVTIEHSRQVE